jgi:hypothetical protein
MMYGLFGMSMLQMLFTQQSPKDHIGRGSSKASQDECFQE